MAGHWLCVLERGHGLFQQMTEHLFTDQTTVPGERRIREGLPCNRHLKCACLQHKAGSLMQLHGERLFVDLQGCVWLSFPNRKYTIFIFVRRDKYLLIRP